MPDDLPVASDEHAPDGTDTNVWPPKFVQPFNASHPGVAGPVIASRSVTELTAIVCSSDAGRFGCFDASSAIDATTTTLCLYAASIAICAWRGFEIAPSASCTTAAPESSANSTPAAKRPPSAMNESPTRTGMKRHCGQLPTSPLPFAAAVESFASPVPCP